MKLYISSSSSRTCPMWGVAPSRGGPFVGSRRPCERVSEERHARVAQHAQALASADAMLTQRRLRARDIGRKLGKAERLHDAGVLRPHVEERAIADRFALSERRGATCGFGRRVTGAKRTYEIQKRSDISLSTNISVVEHAARCKAEENLRQCQSARSWPPPCVRGYACILHVDGLPGWCREPHRRRRRRRCSLSL